MQQTDSKALTSSQSNRRSATSLTGAPHRFAFQTLITATLLLAPSAQSAQAQTATPAPTTAAETKAAPVLETEPAAPTAGTSTQTTTQHQAPTTPLAKPSNPLGQAPTSAVNSGHLFQTSMALLLVVALLFGILWLLKRAGIAGKGQRQGFYKILAISSLGTREKIALIEVGNTWLVVGMTAHSINTLHSMPAGSIPFDDSTSPAVTFAKLLDRVKNQGVKS